MSLKRGFAILCIAAMALGPLGCVDVPSTGPQLPDYRSNFRFINAASDASPGQLFIDGKSQGSLTLSQATAYLDLPAGSRQLVVAGNATRDTVTKAFVTDRRGSVLLFTKGAAAGAIRTVTILNERFSYDTLGATVPADTALVRLANGLSDGTASQAVDVKRVTGTDTLSVATGVAFSAVTGYVKVPAGQHTLLVMAAGTTNVLASAAVSPASKSRHLAVVFGTPAAVSSVGVFQEQ